MTQISEDNATGLPDGNAPRYAVAVAIPNEMARAGLTTMLHQLPAVRELLQYADIDQAMHQITSRRVDALIMGFPEEGAEQLTSLSHAASAAGTKTLFLLSNSSQHEVMRATDLVADGFLLQSEITVERLGSALSQVASGEIAMPSSLARELLSQARRHPDRSSNRPVMLTPREQQALTLLAEGLSNKQIARRLQISEHGAKRHVANVLAKLNSPNRTLAVAIAIREHLLDESLVKQTVKSGY